MLWISIDFNQNVMICLPSSKIEELNFFVSSSRASMHFFKLETNILCLMVSAYNT